MNYQIRCLLSGDILEPSEPIQIRSMDLPGDNWYPAMQATPQNRAWGCGYALFVLINAIWYPIELEEVTA